MTADEYFDIAEQLYRKGEYDKAIDYFKTSFEVEEDDMCLNNIGCCYIELNNYKAAEKIFCELVEANPSWHRPLFNLGRLYLKLGKIDDAIECFGKTLSLKPDHESACYNMGLCYFKLENYETAKEYYQKSINLDNESSDSHLNLGMCLYRLEDFEAALEEFELAYEYDNECIDAFYDKTLALIRLNRYQQALDVLLTYNTDLKTDDAEAMLHLTHCYYKTGDFNNAQSWASKVLIIEPENRLAQLLLKRLTHLMNKTASLREI